MNFSLALEKLTVANGQDINKNAMLLSQLEALGIIKFDQKLAYIPQYKSYGDICIEEWKEGLVLWVGGEIRYRSWK